jgi:serine/threonine protein kinase
MERITEAEVQILDCIYRQIGKVEVYKARLIKTSEFICMKKIYVENVMDATFIQTEFIAMATLQHENIIKLRSASLGGNNREISHVLIFMEYFQRGDLEKFIQSRAKEGGYLSENEILDWLTQLVSAYEFMQERGVAHRDIKPQNIFIDEQNKPKVGDLGSAIKKEGDSATLMGTPMYLSPKLREAFANQASNSFNVPHDVFKSDVYSLGLTFLYLASLISVKDLCQLQNLENKIDARINALPENFSKLKTILKYMLAVDEHFRCDFIELKQKINRLNEVKAVQVANKNEFRKGMTIQQMFAKCSICSKNQDESLIYVFHDYCICLNCVENLKQCVNQDFTL